MTGLARLSRFRLSILMACLVAGAGMAEPLPTPPLSGAPPEPPPAVAGSDFSVMTYNVKGLPWPVASDRSGALHAIGLRLARLRRAGSQPAVVVLQEAFTEEAKRVAELFGYAYRVEGPYTGAAPEGGELEGRQWYLGETGAPLIDSGLIVLSDFPVISVARSPYPAADCAGYDCLAAKGIVLVTLTVPGVGPVEVLTTHMNCRGASGAPRERTDEAYARQARFLAAFVAKHHRVEVPLVMAGDFNQGDRPGRIMSLRAVVAGISDGAPAADVLAADEGLQPLGPSARRDAAWIRKRARDLQFAVPGSGKALAPVAMAVPFGSDADGSMLSDHMGYTVYYRAAPL